MPLTKLVHQQFALFADREQRNHACDREEDEIPNNQLFNPGLLMVSVDIEGEYPILNIATVEPVVSIGNEGVCIRNNGSDSRDKGTDDRNVRRALLGWGGWVGPTARGTPAQRQVRCDGRVRHDQIMESTDLDD